MSDDLKANLTSGKLWGRLVYMLLFSFFLYIASFVIVLLVCVQFLFALFTGMDNKKIRLLSNSVAVYIKDVLMFLSFNSEYKAFPFADWPDPQVCGDVDYAEFENEVETAVDDAVEKTQSSVSGHADSTSERDENVVQEAVQEKDESIEVGVEVDSPESETKQTDSSATDTNPTKDDKGKSAAKEEPRSVAEEDVKST